MTLQTETNLRTFMRQCQRFWQLQWVEKPKKDGSTKPSQVSYELSLTGVYCDLKNVIINKSNVHFASPGDIITESDCSRVFNTEFSSSWEEAKKHYVAGGPFQYQVIPNFQPK